MGQAAFQCLFGACRSPVDPRGPKFCTGEATGSLNQNPKGQGARCHRRKGNYVEPGEKTGRKRSKTPGNERVKFTISLGQRRGDEREKKGGEKGGGKRNLDLSPWMGFEPSSTTSKPSTLPTTL